MKKFSEFRVGDAFYSTCSISEKELEEYLDFSRIRNAFLESRQKGEQQIVSGRAILSKNGGGIYQTQSNLWKSHHLCWNRWRPRVEKQKHQISSVIAYR